MECICRDGCPRVANGFESCEAPFCDCRKYCPVHGQAREQATRPTADLGEDGERAVALATKRIEGKAHGYVTLAVADVRALLGAVLSRSGL